MKEEIKNWLAVVVLVAMLLCAFAISATDPILALNVAICGVIFLAGRWAVVRIYRRWFSDEREVRQRLQSGIAILITTVLIGGSVMSYAQYTQNPYTNTPTVNYNPTNNGFDANNTGNYYYTNYSGGFHEWVTNNIWLWGPVMSSFGKMFQRNDDPMANLRHSGRGLMSSAQP